MKNNKVTINDISTALGVSSVSVSRALSGQSGVGEELKNRIIEKAREMGYTKNKKTDQVNILVLHQKPYKEDTSNFSYMVQGVEKALQRNDADYSVEFIDNETQNDLVLPYKLSKGINFDGVILLGRFKLEYANLIKQKIDNLIFFTGYSPSYDFDCVRFNFNNAGYKQCEYLIKNGHESIGFLGSNTQFKNKEKLLGITEAMEDYRVPYKKEFFIEAETGYPSKFLKLIESGNLPSAFICEDDFKAVELIKLLNSNKIRVPEDVSVLGSGNTDISILCTPSLTTLDLNIEYACESVVDTLLKRIQTPDKPCETIAVLSKLIERESVRFLKE
ncbi:MAG: LacI family DNA-binding transcriptional regulator [Clostridiaceae bacterium]